MRSQVRVLLFFFFFFLVYSCIMQKRVCKNARRGLSADTAQVLEDALNASNYYAQTQDDDAASILDWLLRESRSDPSSPLHCALDPEDVRKFLEWSRESRLPQVDRKPGRECCVCHHGLLAAANAKCNFCWKRASYGARIYRSKVRLRCHETPCISMHIPMVCFDRLDRWN
jgi:hypothetical protein